MLTDPVELLLVELDDDRVADPDQLPYPTAQLVNVLAAFTDVNVEEVIAGNDMLSVTEFVME